MSQKIVLGVGAGIAAYKSCDLLRRFQDSGFDVTVVPTPSSLNFVGKATWEALSGKKVNTEVWEEIDQVNHVSLGDLADYIVIAPATADLIARLTQGRADDLLTNTFLASTARKMIVPAMHPKMWLNEATQENVRVLRSRGIFVMDPAIGRLTGADSGIGRFPDTTHILNTFFQNLANEKDLANKKILITVGGTREDIDDVRYIGNNSSGKQGRAIAEQAIARGAKVTVIGANIEPVLGAKNIPVRTTLQMQIALNAEFDNCDAVIMAAAVSDAKPTNFVAGKIKKSQLAAIELELNPDLLAEIGRKKVNQVIVGFAAESENLIAEGIKKLANKNLDLIYVNAIQGGSIFGSDNSTGCFIWNEAGTSRSLEISDASKSEVATKLLDLLTDKLN